MGETDFTRTHGILEYPVRRGGLGENWKENMCLEGSGGWDFERKGEVK